MLWSLMSTSPSSTSVQKNLSTPTFISTESCLPPFQSLSLQESGIEEVDLIAALTFLSTSEQRLVAFAAASGNCSLSDLVDIAGYIRHRRNVCLKDLFDAGFDFMLNNA